MLVLGRVIIPMSSDVVFDERLSSLMLLQICSGSVEKRPPAPHRNELVFWGVCHNCRRNLVIFIYFYDFYVYIYFMFIWIWECLVFNMYSLPHLKKDLKLSSYHESISVSSGVTEFLFHLFTCLPRKKMRCRPRSCVTHKKKGSLPCEW